MRYALTAAIASSFFSMACESAPKPVYIDNITPITFDTYAHKVYKNYYQSTQNTLDRGRRYAKAMYRAQKNDSYTPPAPKWSYTTSEASEFNNWALIYAKDYQEDLEKISKRKLTQDEKIELSRRKKELHKNIHDMQAIRYGFLSDGGAGEVIDTFKTTKPWPDYDYVHEVPQNQPQKILLSRANQHWLSSKVYKQWSTHNEKAEMRKMYRKHQKKELDLTLQKVKKKEPFYKQALLDSTLWHYDSKKKRAKNYIEPFKHLITLTQDNGSIEYPQTAAYGMLKQFPLQKLSLDDRLKLPAHYLSSTFETFLGKQTKSFLKAKRYIFSKEEEKSLYDSEYFTALSTSFNELHHARTTLAKQHNSNPLLTSQAKQTFTTLLTKVPPSHILYDRVHLEHAFWYYDPTTKKALNYSTPYNELITLLQRKDSQDVQVQGQAYNIMLKFPMDNLSYTDKLKLATCYTSYEFRKVLEKQVAHQTKKLNMDNQFSIDTFALHLKARLKDARNQVSITLQAVKDNKITDETKKRQLKQKAVKEYNKILTQWKLLHKK